MATDISVTTMSGRITMDGEMRYTPNGTALLRFDIANNRSYKKNDDWQTDVNYIECNVWGKYAESLIEKIKKGVTVLVSGRLKQDRWEDQDGKKRSKHILVCESVQVFAKGENANKDENNYDDEIPY